MVVVAYVGGQGASAPQYDDYSRYAQPFNYAWMNLSGGVSFEERQHEIPLGEEAMFRHFQRAIDSYSWGYDLPNQPPNIKLAFRSTAEGKTEIRWSAFGEDTLDPDYEGGEARDLRGYRIYLSRGEYQGPWEFVSEFSIEEAGTLPRGIAFNPTGVFRTTPDAQFFEGIPLRESPYHSGVDPDAGVQLPGVYTFQDLNGKLSFPGWYSVRYYDSGHANWKNTGQAVSVLESAPGPSGGAITGGRRGIVPFVVGTAVFDRLEAQVRAVPNPLKIDSDLHSFSRASRIRFVNLPAKCQIDIYNVAGQHAWTKFHGNPTKAEAIWGLEVKGNNDVMPGIYFWKVTSLMPESEGRTQKGTFIIIR